MQRVIPRRHRKRPPTPPQCARRGNACFSPHPSGAWRGRFAVAGDGQDELLGVPRQAGRIVLALECLMALLTASALSGKMVGHPVVIPTPGGHHSGKRPETDFGWNRPMVECGRQPVRPGIHRRSPCARLRARPRKYQQRDSWVVPRGRGILHRPSALRFCSDTGRSWHRPSCKSRPIRSRSRSRQPGPALQRSAPGHLGLQLFARGPARQCVRRSASQVPRGRSATRLRSVCAVMSYSRGI